MRIKGNKKQSKVNQQARHRAVEACNDAAIREPPPKTWAARKPAYAYTPLCPDPELREVAGGSYQGEEAEAVELIENELKKQFLWSYQKAKREVWRLEEQLAELRLNKLSPSVINDGMPHGTDQHDLSDYAAKLDEIEQEITAARYRRICAFQDVQRQIEVMEDEREKELLTYRYLRGLKWEEVAVKMGYSWKQTHRIHAKALENFKMT